MLFPLDVFVILLKEAYSQYDVAETPLKGNDLEKFHFLTGGPLAIDLAPNRLEENLERIKDLILNKKFEDSIDYQQKNANDYRKRLKIVSN